MTKAWNNCNPIKRKGLRTFLTRDFSYPTCRFVPSAFVVSNPKSGRFVPKGWSIRTLCWLILTQRYFSCTVLDFVGSLLFFFFFYLFRTLLEMVISKYWSWPRRFVLIFIIHSPHQWSILRVYCFEISSLLCVNPFGPG